MPRKHRQAIQISLKNTVVCESEIQQRDIHILKCQNFGAQFRINAITFVLVQYDRLEQRKESILESDKSFELIQSDKRKEEKKVMAQDEIF